MSTIDQTEEGPRNLISLKEFEKKKYELQVELLKWQHYVKDNGEKHIIIFEGKDGAGKGGTIKRFMEHMNPKSARVVALDNLLSRKGLNGIGKDILKSCLNLVRLPFGIGLGITGPQ